MTSVEVRENIPLKGRGLFAVKDVPEKAVIFEEKPLVCAQFIWNAFYKYLACDHCLKSLENAEEQARRLTEQPHLELPFPECCHVDKQPYVQCPQCEIWYCSSECRDEALAQYHQTLCLGPHRDNPRHPINRLIETWRDIHHPPETLSITLILRMIAMVKQAEDKSAMVQRFQQFQSVTRNEEEGFVHKLLGEHFQEPLEILRGQLHEALYVEEVQHWYTPEGFRSLFGMIGTNGQGMGTSTVCMWTSKVEELNLPEEQKAQLEKFLDNLYSKLDETAGEFLNVEGSALYSQQSICNHSCEPNAEAAYPHNNSTLQLRALAPIKAGEEIHISYLDPCHRSRSRHSRQKYLKEHYLFLCACSKCTAEADDPDETSEDEDDDEDEDMSSEGADEEDSDDMN